MTCVQKFIAEHYDYLSKMCVGMVGAELGEDLWHDLCVLIVEDKDGKYADLCARDEIMYYVLGVIRINAYSKNTRFYYKYLKHKEHHTAADIRWQDIKQQEIDNTSEEHVERKLLEAKELLKEVPWFEAEVFKIYYLHSHSLQSLSDATGISRTTINQALHRARHKLRSAKKASATKAQNN